MAKNKLLVLVGTTKGAFIFRSDGTRRAWKLEGPHFLGSVVHHLVLDPRDRRTLLMAAKTGHLGPTVFRSTDGGRSWKEAARPPAFPKVPEGQTGRAVDATFWLTPGHASEPGVWYAGTVPHGLFRSEDGGATWTGVGGFNDHPMYEKWSGGGATPGGKITHSILVDPRDRRHLYLGLSVGGTFESTDRGAGWKPLNKGVELSFAPPGDHEYGHDPHQMVIHPLTPDRLYQANHCGTYRIDRPGDRWERIGKALPPKVGDIGFCVVTHPRDPDTAWVFPMDGTDVWPRTSPDGKPAVYRTRDAGASWQRLDKGLPRKEAWLTVKRQAFCADDRDPLGLYFGTSSGELWSSRDEGKSWKRMVEHLPHVYAVTSGTMA